MRTRVKICGITRSEDALHAVHYGADAIGLVFYAPSPRNVSIATAQEIVKHIPAFVTVTALFVDAETDFVLDVMTHVKPSLLQFHGDELPKACAQYSLPYIKAIRVKPETNLIQYAKDYDSASALLLDAYTEGLVGGTGHQFDWNLIPETLTKPMILAGGLNKENVAKAIKQTKPFAVDVSGGVELSKGIKSEAEIAAFMHQVSLNNASV